MVSVTCFSERPCCANKRTAETKHHPCTYSVFQTECGAHPASPRAHIAGLDSLVHPQDITLEEKFFQKFPQRFWKAKKTLFRFQLPQVPRNAQCLQCYVVIIATLFSLKNIMLYLDVLELLLKR
jgi:hypothetical protein